MAIYIHTVGFITILLSISLCASGVEMEVIFIVHGFWPESDFGKKECQAIAHLKGNGMVQISAL